MLVELALVFTPFMALALTTIELCLPIFQKATFEDAVREGCRFGITFSTTYNGSTYGSQTLAIKAVVQANAMGFLSDPTKISVKYFNAITFADVTNAATPNADGNIIQVSVTGYQYNWIAPVQWMMGGVTFGLPTTPLTITATSSDRLETIPPGTTRPTA